MPESICRNFFHVPDQVGPGFFDDTPLDYRVDTEEDIPDWSESD